MRGRRERGGEEGGEGLKPVIVKEEVEGEEEEWGEGISLKSRSGRRSTVGRGRDLLQPFVSSVGHLFSFEINSKVGRPGFAPWSS